MIFFIIFGIWGRVCPKRPQDSLKIAAGWPTRAYLNPTWAQVGSKLAQVGPILDPSWLQLGSSWAHVGPISGPPAALGPTQALPNPIKEATSHPPGLGSRMWSLGRLLLDLQNPQPGSQNTPTWLQKVNSRASNPAAQARRMGRSLFNRVWKGLGWLRGGWGPGNGSNLGPT